MSSSRRRQYTLRGIPSRLDEALRRKAQTEGKSLNEVAVEALLSGVGLAGQQPTFHDLDDLAGTWVEDPDFDDAIHAQDQPDSALWK